MAKHPPLLPKLRPAFAALRVLGFLILATSVWLGIGLISRNETADGVRTFVGGLSFAAATLVSPYSPLVLVFLAIALFAFPLGGPAAIFFIVTTGALLIWLAFRRVRTPDLDPEGVRRVGDDAVMPHAVEFVEEFESLGWGRVGAVAADLGHIEITMAILHSPDKRSYVEVTDIVIAITSVFPDGKTMVTRNSTTSAMPPWVLANDHRGAKPTALVTAHENALTVLANRGVRPEAIPEAELVDVVIVQEKASISFSSGADQGSPLLTRGKAAIDHSQAAEARIDLWMQERGRAS